VTTSWNQHWLLNEHVATQMRTSMMILFSGHFSSALGSAPNPYQQRFLKHLSGVVDAMADFVQVALLVQFVTKPITYTM
jgi:hypothetical protein